MLVSIKSISGTSVIGWLHYVQVWCWLDEPFLRNRPEFGCQFSVSASITMKKKQIDPNSKLTSKPRPISQKRSIQSTWNLHIMKSTNHWGSRNTFHWHQHLSLLRKSMILWTKIFFSHLVLYPIRVANRVFSRLGNGDQWGWNFACDHLTHTIENIHVNQPCNSNSDDDI